MASSMHELLDQTMAAMAAGADLSPYLVDDVLMMGTDPDEWWEGRADVLAAYVQQDQTLGQPTFEPEGDRRVRELGDTAWAAEHVNVRFENASLRMRLTGVAVREQDGQWRFAQLQSAPVTEPAAP